MAEQLVKLLCGEDTVDLRVPESVRVPEMEAVEPLSDPDGAVRQALADPIKSSPLNELARGKKDACVVISDITCPVPNQIILPPMLNILEESGIKREDITILIAARDILKKGGTIVVVCECREGLGNPEFCGIMTSVCSPQEFFDGYCDPKNFVIDQWCAQNIYQALSHAGQVYIYSPGLSQADLEKTGATKIENVQETVDQLLESHANVVAVPDGPYVVGICNA